MYIYEGGFIAVAIETVDWLHYLDCEAVYCSLSYVTAFHVTSPSFSHPFILQLVALCVRNYVCTTSTEYGQ